LCDPVFEPAQFVFNYIDFTFNSGVYFHPVDAVMVAVRMSKTNCEIPAVSVWLAISERGVNIHATLEQPRM